MIQAYKHVFTSPSSVEKEPKATRSGNASMHGMTQVTPPSIAYIATQVSVAVYFNTLYHADGCVSHRADFPCLHRLYFLEHIRSLIPRDFIIQFLTFSTTLTRNTRSTISLTGGTG